MTDTFSTWRLVSRLTLAIAAVTAAATGAYLLLVPFVLGEQTESDRYLAAGSIAAGCALGVLLVQMALRLPRLFRLAAASRAGDLPDPFDREAAYAAPREAATLAATIGVLVLVWGYLPWGGLAAEGRTLATHIGAVCAVLAGGVLYAAVRLALRPLVEALRDDPQEELGTEARALSDRVWSRVALAVAVPAGAAALVATLMVGTHLRAIDNDQEGSSREIFNEALHVERRPGESEAGLESAASDLRAAGMHVERVGDVFAIPSEAPPTPSPPFWALPIALIVGLIGGQVGRRIGLNASVDLETASRRMAVVGIRDIRSVTMSMARPRSIPEIRETALALDTLAATLLRMAEDQQRALTVRTEAARVRSFVLASVSHDLRGPLNSVLGFAELLLSGVEGTLTPGQQESLEALSRGGRDLLRLVGDLLDHARIDAGRMAIERARVTLDGVVERARSSAIERAKGPVHPDDIGIEGEAGLVLFADEEHLGQALGALVAFALLRPGSDGHVVIRVRREDHSVAVTIRGGGSTPAREALQRMFEPFDFAPSGARAPAGLNLAVSVARGIIRLHGGMVEADPHDDGGIALWVTLPVAG